jgi:hypothetical protein
MIHVLRHTRDGGVDGVGLRLAMLAIVCVG